MTTALSPQHELTLPVFLVETKDLSQHQTLPVGQMVAFHLLCLVNTGGGDTADTVI